MCIALTHEFGIDHEVTHIDVSQEATITIPERHVQLDPDVFALDQMPVGNVPRTKIKDLLARNYPPLTQAVLEIIEEGSALQIYTPRQ